MPRRASIRSIDEPGVRTVAVADVIEEIVQVDAPRRIVEYLARCQTSERGNGPAIHLRS